MDDSPDLSPDERAAVRAYLQRSEVRLSTVHRVASALLSGAGLLVVLPAVTRDSVFDVLRALLEGPVSVSDRLLAVAVVIVLAVPLMALVFLLRDLTQFYFHANHVGGRSDGTFTPRFTLTALRLPADELGPDAAADLGQARAAEDAVGLLVPTNPLARARVDRRLSVYGLDSAEPGDQQRADALFALAASHPRGLLDEVAKVEHGMTRHVLRIQTIVLRYVKALLALLTTALAVFTASAITGGDDLLSVADDAWLAGVLLAWGPAVVLAVTSPVRWLEDQLRSEVSTATAVTDDPDLTGVEVLSVRLALVGMLFAAGAMTAAVVEVDASRSVQVGGALTLVVTFVTLAWVLHRWAGRHLVPRLIGRG